MKKILVNTVYSDATLKSWKKEDLIELIRILEHNWAAAEESLNNSVKNSDKIFYEQKAEIERLKIDLEHEKNWGKIQTKQAVKDTAKEILQGFMKWIKQAISDSYEEAVKGSVRYGGKNTAFHEVKELVKKVAESKGVEVE